MTAVAFVMTIRTVTESNAKEHWRVKARRAKAQRLAAHATAYAFLSCEGAAWREAMARGAIAVTMTRISAGTMDDDNLASACKHIRDGIADALGIDDRDPRVRWRVEQRRGERGRHAVEIRIEACEVSS